MERGFILRYSRQLPLIGIGGQEKLSKSTALVVGAGGLGSPVLLYLAAAGVGRIIVVDKGYVDLPDLNRQIVYDEGDIGRPKAEAAAERLRRLNSSISVTGYSVDVADSSFEELAEQADVVIDCLDNWPSRLRLNDVAVRHSKPLVHAGVWGTYGQVTTVIPGQTPCLRCLIPSAAESRGGEVACPITGAFICPVIGFTPAILGLIEVSEALRLMLGERPVLAGTLMTVDLNSLEFTKIKVERRRDCPACGGIAPRTEGPSPGHRAES